MKPSTEELKKARGGGEVNSSEEERKLPNPQSVPTLETKKQCVAGGTTQQPRA